MISGRQGYTAARSKESEKRHDVFYQTSCRAVLAGTGVVFGDCRRRMRPERRANRAIGRIGAYDAPAGDSSRSRSIQR